MQAPRLNHSFQPASTPSCIPGAAVFRSFLGLWHNASSARIKYALSLDSLLVPLAVFRCVLFREVLAPLLTPWAMTRGYWYAYILVCVHWTLVMHSELHSIKVIKKCYSSIFRILSQGNACKYPLNLCLGMVFLLVVTLSVCNIFNRAIHSAFEWGGQRTLAFQITLLLLLGIHSYAILLQGTYICPLLLLWVD